jgi:hypothetical protein
MFKKLFFSLIVFVLLCGCATVMPPYYEQKYEQITTCPFSDGVWEPGHYEYVSHWFKSGHWVWISGHWAHQYDFFSLNYFKRPKTKRKV